MITIVFVIGAINLGLGFALAVLLERPFEVPSLRIMRRLVRQRVAKRQPGPVETPPPPAAPPPPPPQVESTIPEPRQPRRNEFPWLFPEWAELLTTRDVVVESFPEALLWVVSTKLADYCEQLRQCEQQSRAVSPENTLGVLRAICADCRTHFADWKTAIRGCEERDQHREQLEVINQWLEEPVQQFQRVEQLGRQAEAQTDSSVDGKSLRQHILPIFSHLRGLLDQCDESLANCLREQKRFGELPESEIRSPGSKVLSRMGLESTLFEWLEKDPDRVRMASALLVNIDHCAQLNERHGLLITGNILAASLRLLSEVVRKDRGFDRVAQFTGSTFLVFLGDTALRNAMVGSERVRQHLAAAGFHLDESRISITASCAVAEWNALESFDKTIARLLIGIKEAKAAGRNCTVVCGPEENRVAPASVMTVTAREFTIDPSGFVQK